MAINRETSEPTVLYKYMSADRALRVLPENGNGALRATQPGALNDPLECATICGAAYSSEDEEVQEIVETLNWIMPEHQVTKSNVQLTRRQLGTQAWNELFRKQLSRRFGVVSFSSSPLYPLLWAHYADSGKGVVVGYRTEELKKIVAGYERVGSVQYLDEPPPVIGHVTFKDEGNLHVSLLVKARYWEYEAEWRLTLELKNTVGTGEFDQNLYSINVCPIPNEAVTEVYVTERTPQSAIDKIEARLRNTSNRYKAGAPQRLTLASDKYGYEL